MDQPFWERFKMWVCDKIGHIKVANRYWIVPGKGIRGHCEFCDRDFMLEK